ncbi:hypothetical protein BpHYR1_044300 [Brachionus plicatilis]|uniref:Uncharacterized protein n=1 Tax=Brachionus plicatilis TaxID=10195 RepID=A0A3M7SAG7_BRAPC|nr:hypothetical protein BpHYR1_044300 [Brachionus plicatilis]
MANIIFNIYFLLTSTNYFILDKNNFDLYILDKLILDNNYIDIFNLDRYLKFRHSIYLLNSINMAEKNPDTNPRKIIIECQKSVSEEVAANLPTYNACRQLCNSAPVDPCVLVVLTDVSQIPVQIKDVDIIVVQN